MRPRRADFEYRPDLVSRRRRSRRRRPTRSLTTSIPKRAGATGFPSRRGTSSSPTTVDPPSRSCRSRTRERSGSARPSRPRRRREDGQGGSPLAVRRLARALPVRPARARAQGRGPHEGLERAGSAIRRRAAPIGSGPFLRRALGAREAARPSSATRATGDRTRPTSTGSSSASAGSAVAAPSRPSGCARASSTSSMSALLTGAQRSGAPAACRESGCSRSRRPDWEHLASGSAPGGHPALERKLVRQALAYGIDRVGLARALYGELAAALPAERQRRLPHQQRSLRPNWSGYRLSPGAGATPARAGGLPPGAGRYLRVRRASGSRCAS